jgi:hypothetical protein
MTFIVPNSLTDVAHTACSPNSRTPGTVPSARRMTACDTPFALGLYNDNK